MEGRHVLVPAPGPPPLLGRPRSWVTASTLSLFALALSLLLTLSSLRPAQAQYPGGGYPGGGYPGASAYIDEGSYVGPVYTGGTITTSVTGNYSLNSDGTYGGQYYAGGGSDANGANITSGSVSCSGEIKTTYTWNNADPNLVPPHCVIVVEHCIAQWHGSTSNGATLTGGCANPLGGSSVLDVPGPGATWEFTKYTVQSGTAPDGPLPTVTVSSSPEADAECAGSSAPRSASNGIASVKYTASPIIPPQLQAHSTVDTNGVPDAGGNYTHPWDPFHPRFFSGTNCNVVGTAMAYKPLPGSYPAGGTYVMQASLSINGTAVKLYYDTSFIGPVSPGSATGTNQGSVPLSVFFDSTHFADNSTITARMNVTDSGGLSYMVPVSGPAINNVLAIANQTSSWIDVYTNQNVAENAVSGAVQGTSTQANYQPYPGVVPQTIPTHFNAQGIDSYHKPDLISAISCPASSFAWTVFFAATHSYHGLIGDCYSTTTSDTATVGLSDTDIQAAVAAKAAGPNPEPYLFVQVHGCDGGGSPALANDFGIPYSSSDDRAFVGFAAVIAVNQRNTNFTTALWHYLFMGQTTDLAKIHANKDFPIQVYIDQNTKPNDLPGNTTIPVGYGDNDMTLSGKVYKWASGPTWYR